MGGLLVRRHITMRASVRAFAFADAGAFLVAFVRACGAFRDSLDKSKQLTAN
jgi:hypothetical protein